MVAVLDSYKTIDHGKGFYETVFRDFKRETLTAWLKAADERYPMLRALPRLRILYDVRAVITFTPYAIHCFRQTIYREYPADTRAAFVVQGNVLNLLLQMYIKRYQANKGRSSARVFFSYDAAMRWLLE